MPILTMSEALRRQFMCRIHTKRLFIEKSIGKLCSIIQDKVTVIKKTRLWSLSAMFLHMVNGRSHYGKQGLGCGLEQTNL